MPSSDQVTLTLRVDVSDMDRALRKVRGLIFETTPFGRRGLSHRAEHRATARGLRQDVMAREDRRPTGEEYRAARRFVARLRRSDQARIKAGTDRYELRIQRAMAEVVEPPF